MVYRLVQMFRQCLAGMFLEDMECDHVFLEGNKNLLNMVLQYNSKQQLPIACMFCFPNVHNLQKIKEGISLSSIGENKTQAEKIYLHGSELNLI